MRCRSQSLGRPPTRCPGFGKRLGWSTAGHFVADIAYSHQEDRENRFFPAFFIVATRFPPDRDEHCEPRRVGDGQRPRRPRATVLEGMFAPPPNARCASSTDSADVDIAGVAPSHTPTRRPVRPQYCYRCTENRSHADCRVTPRASPTLDHVTPRRRSSATQARKSAPT